MADVVETVDHRRNCPGPTERPRSRLER